MAAEEEVNTTTPMNNKGPEEEATAEGATSIPPDSNLNWQVNSNYYEGEDSDREDRMNNMSDDETL